MEIIYEFNGRKKEEYDNTFVDTSYSEKKSTRDEEEHLPSLSDCCKKSLDEIYAVGSELNHCGRTLEIEIKVTLSEEI